jgi:hydroxymethylpyrimidine pyrophosphatase-like HAD family hydrolase
VESGEKAVRSERKNPVSSFHSPLPSPHFSLTEADFYGAYPWCLNPYPTVGEAVEHLKRELARLGQERPDWQTGEVMTNVFLLSCALLNAVDDHLRGKTFSLPGRFGRLRLVRFMRWSLEKLRTVVQKRGRSLIRCWRDQWQQSLDAFLSLFIDPQLSTPTALADAGARLAELLTTPLPATLHGEHIYFPSAFRKHDLTHFDVLALGRKFIGQFPDRGQRILILGLRTAGSWFAPVLLAFLRAQGYQSVEMLTVRPERGPGASEAAVLKRCARDGYLAMILDDSPRTGSSVVLAADIVRKAGFASGKLAALVPVHPATRDWREHPDSLSLAAITVLTLAAEEWRKVKLLDSPAAVEDRLREYFPDATLTVSLAEQFNAQLQSGTEELRRARLKRVYEVHLTTPEGKSETRHILAKSVGWGWLGYHAFLAGQRLSSFVPPVLGLRDGILFSVWIPQSVPTEGSKQDREHQITAAASYVAARARCLSLGKNPLPSLGPGLHHDSLRLLDRVLSRAYGGTLPANLRRPRLRKRLANQPCPFPTLVDGKMEPSEWIAGPDGLLKTDFEHHGMGKNELNVVDPACDLAQTILHLGLSPEEEGFLIRRYSEESGDTEVVERLFLNKLLAGFWATASALKALFQQPMLLQRQQELHQQFLEAWYFLTVQTARYCGTYCQRPAAPLWRSPLVVLDIDGVLDRRIFGFPCTTAAGIKALALLHAHEFSIAVDTARSAWEVKDYCRAYGFAGGVAESGSYAWDAVKNTGRSLVSAESHSQLESAREALARLPGVFLDDRYQHSIRACTYEARAEKRSLLATALGSPGQSPYEGKYPVPLPTLTIHQLLAAEGLDRLCVQQTTIDTTITAREVDKGTGLLALLALAGQPEAETLVVGDSEPDLPMFRVAHRSFAPSQIACARQARALGCRIARQPFQRGLLSIVRSVIHPRGGHCSHCRSLEPGRLREKEVFLELLEAADRSRLSSLLRALVDPSAYQVFMR